MTTDSKDGGGAFDSAMSARTPGRDIFGPLDDELPKVRVPAEVLMDARRRAHELGLDLTAFLRLNLYSSLYGVDHVTTLHRKQLERVVGNAPHQNVENTGVPSFLRVTPK